MLPRRPAHCLRDMMWGDREAGGGIPRCALGTINTDGAEPTRQALGGVRNYLPSRLGHGQSRQTTDYGTASQRPQDGVGIPGTMPRHARPARSPGPMWAVDRQSDGAAGHAGPEAQPIVDTQPPRLRARLVMMPARGEPLPLYRARSRLPRDSARGVAETIPTANSGRRCSNTNLGGITAATAPVRSMIELPPGWK